VGTLKDPSEGRTQVYGADLVCGNPNPYGVDQKWEP